VRFQHRIEATKIHIIVSNKFYCSLRGALAHSVFIHTLHVKNKSISSIKMGESPCVF
jgi:hypothetical protein